MVIDEDTMNASIRPSANAQVETELLIEAVIKAEGLTATDEECDEYVKKVSESIGASEDEIKSYFGKDFITRELLRERATNIILDSAVVKAAE